MTYYFQADTISLQKTTLEARKLRPLAHCRLLWISKIYKEQIYYGCYQSPRLVKRYVSGDHRDWPRVGLPQFRMKPDIVKFWVNPAKLDRVWNLL